MASQSPTRDSGMAWQGPILRRQCFTEQPSGLTTVTRPFSAVRMLDANQKRGATKDTWSICPTFPVEGLLAAQGNPQSTQTF